MERSRQGHRLVGSYHTTPSKHLPMFAPHDIWLDSALAVTTNIASRYLLAKHKGDRMSRMDCERLGVTYVDGSGISETVATRPSDTATVRTAALTAPQPAASPRKRRR